MKRKFRRIASFVLSLAIMLTLSVPAQAAKTYNANAALAYAKSHWNAWNKDKVLCAEFVAKCLYAGGCPISRDITMCTDLANRLENGKYGEFIQLTLDPKKRGEEMRCISVDKNRDKISPGDPIFFYCPGCKTITKSRYTHVVLYSGPDSQGRMCCYARNGRMNNETIKFGDCGYKYDAEYPCYSEITEVWVFHMNGSSGSTASSKPEYFNCNVRIDCIKGKTVNLYNAPEDSIREDYFDRGQTAYSTYGAKLSDGSVWYQTKVRSSKNGAPITVWLKYEKSKMTVKDLAASASKPVTLSASASSVSLDLSGKKSQTITLELGGDVPEGCNLAFQSSDSSVAITSQGNYTRGYRIPMVITARNAGKCMITYTVKDAADKVLKKAAVNVTVTAPSYTVTYNANGGSGAPAAQTKLYQKALTLSDTQPTRAGYTFEGWGTTAASGALVRYRPGDLYQNDRSITFYAVWAPGSTEPDEPADPTQKLVTLSADRSGISLDLNGKKSQTVTLELGGEVPADCALIYEVSNPDVASVDWGTSQKGLTASAVITAKKAGDCTITFSAKSKNTGKVLAAIPVDVTVTAPASTYTVRYDANGGTGAPAAQTRTAQKALTLSGSQPTRSGYTFEGWATSADGPVQYYPGEQYTENRDVILYAVWKAVSSVSSKPVTLSASTDRVNLDLSSKPSQTITLYLGGDVPEGCNIGKSISNDNVVSSRWGNYTEENWSAPPAILTAKSAGTCTITYTLTDRNGQALAATSVQVTVTAPVSTYVVRYDANGGTGAPPAQTKTAQEALTLSGSQPTRDGYTFKGWATSPGGSVEYRPGDRYTADRDVTLYAVWETEAVPSRPVTLSASTNRVSLEMGGKESQTITLYLGGDVPEGCQLDCFISNPEVVSSSWGNYKDGYTVPVTITAKKAGMTAINYSVLDSTGKVLDRIPVAVVVSAAKPAEPSGPQYFSCNVRIDCVAGKTVNLYKNPGDSSRVDYFDLGQTMWSSYGVKMTDGSTWYQGRVMSGSTPMDVWLKYESGKMAVTDMG